MRVVSWNIENAPRCFPALPGIVEDLGTPDVFCLQEHASGHRMMMRFVPWRAPCPAMSVITRLHAIRATLPFGVVACMALRRSSVITGVRM